MKKLSIGILTVVALVFGVNQQASAQVEQGSIIIDPYYGFPNLGKSWAQGLVPADASNVNVIGIGPAGLRAEYLISDNFGVGIDAIYNTVGLDYNYTSSDSLGNTQTYAGTLKMQRLRIMLRMNYHFVQTDVMDAYVGFGAGYNNRVISDDSNEPGYEGLQIKGALLPVSARIALGARFYFTDNIGINAELGIGGPVVSAGLSVKF